MYLFLSGKLQLSRNRENFHLAAEVFQECSQKGIYSDFLRLWNKVMRFSVMISV